MDCHVTQGLSKFVEGNKWNTMVAEFGIACETCHSEGREHIDANRNPFRRWQLHLTKSADATIANAKRMKGPESSLVCGQCHSVWAFNGWTQSSTGTSTAGSSVRGKRTSCNGLWFSLTNRIIPRRKDFIRRTEPDFYRNRFWGDGMIRVTGRETNGVQESPCFKGGNFSCISCHEMHPDDDTRVALNTWARSDQLAPKMDSDQACLQCHKEMVSAPNDSHSSRRRLFRKPLLQLPHAAHHFRLTPRMRSHQVSSPNVRESLDYGRPNACNLCHLNETLSWDRG
jgi:nitrate/TMAO reductase-like tetraheme cytochrome c subunit